jgi:orotate phosphoribosyltransferase
VIQIEEDVRRLLPGRRGHFRLESGHHGDLWLELESLCYRTTPLRALAKRLSELLIRHRVDVVCGPLIEGAFVALMVAEELDLPFIYSEPQRSAATDGLFTVTYSVPGALRAKVANRRVAIVNDVVNAGSAVRGTFDDLIACDAQPVVIATLAILGTAAASFARDKHVALERLCELPNTIWTPAECPLCAAHVPLSLA